MAKHEKRDWKWYLKGLGVIAFAGGFLFAQPMVAAGGAIAWGGATLLELFMPK